MKNEDLIGNALEDIFRFMGIKPNVNIVTPEENVYAVDIQGNNLNFLIGYQGESLNALQSLLGLMTLKRLGKPLVVTIDINDYKSKKSERILGIAKDYIDKVRFFEKEIQMPTMNPWERRQVHVFISEYPDVESESVGEEPNRRVVLKPKKR